MSVCVGVAARVCVRGEGGQGQYPSKQFRLNLATVTRVTGHPSDSLSCTRDKVVRVHVWRCCQGTSFHVN